MVLVIVGSLHGAEIQVPAGQGKLFFNPKAQKPIVFKLDNGIVLRTTGETEVPENFKKYQVIITQPGKQPVSVSLPNEIVQINSITPASDNQVALIGMVNGSVYEVAIIDVLKYQIADQFLAYRPAPSPDGRFIVFIKFYPPHGYNPSFYPGGPSDFVMIYDATLGSFGNRPAGVDIDNKTDVGMAVYPPGVKTQDPVVGLSEADINSVTGEFFWAEDSSKFVFNAEHQLKNAPTVTRIIRGKSVEVAQAEASLVLVDLTFPHAPKVRAFQADVCVGLCTEPLMSVEFGTSGLKAQLGVGPKQRSIEVRYDQFTSP
jgi:hypothetical protein